MEHIERVKIVRDYIKSTENKGWAKETGFPCFSFKDNNYSITLCYYKMHKEVSLYFIDFNQHPQQPFSYILKNIEDSTFQDLKDKYENLEPTIREYTEDDMKKNGYF